MSTTDETKPAGKSGRTKVREGGQMTVVSTPRAPKAIGPYSQAVQVGDAVYTSGQIALDPATGQMIDGDVRAQATQVLANLKAVIEAHRNGMAHSSTPPTRRSSDLSARSAVMVVLTSRRCSISLFERRG